MTILYQFLLQRCFAVHRVPSESGLAFLTLHRSTAEGCLGEPLVALQQSVPCLKVCMCRLHGLSNACNVLLSSFPLPLQRVLLNLVTVVGQFLKMLLKDGDVALDACLAQSTKLTRKIRNLDPVSSNLLDPVLLIFYISFLHL